MTDEERATWIVERMGFPATETGPYVTMLRADILRQVRDHGLMNRSGGTWAHELDPDEPVPTMEERARELLAWDWELEHGNTVRIELGDSAPIQWRFNVKTMRWRLQIRPHLLAPWLRDRWRLFLFDWTRARRRDRNPYRT